MRWTQCQQTRFEARRILSISRTRPQRISKTYFHVIQGVYNPGFSSEDGMSNRGDRRRNPFQNGSTRHLHGVFLRNDLPESLSGDRVAGIPHADSISVFDARDAIETCSGLWGEEKDACYAVFGVDCGAEMWFDTVYKLEESLALETGPDELGAHQNQERC